MKTKNLFHMMAFGAMAFIVSSCGGSSSVDSDGLFGDIPQIIWDANGELIQITEKIKALDGEDSGGMEKMQKLGTQYEELENEMNKKLDEAVAKIKDVEVKAEIGGGFPFEIVGSPILTGVSNGNPMTATFKIKLRTTQEITTPKHSFYSCYFKVVNKKGEVIDAWSAGLLPLPEKNALGIETRDFEEDKTYPAGQKFEESYFLSLKKDYEDREELTKAAAFDKFVFITKEEYNSLKK